MYLLPVKALIAVISASVLAIGVALAPAVGGAHRHAPVTTSRTTSLEADGLQFLGQFAAGNVEPDAALRQSWIDDVAAVAHSLGLTNRALARQIRAGHSLAQIASSRGVPTSTATTGLLRHVRDDLDRAEHDQTISPTAASALVNALTTALGNP